MRLGERLVRETGIQAWARGPEGHSTSVLRAAAEAPTTSLLPFAQVWPTRLRSGTSEAWASATRVGRLADDLAHGSEEGVSAARESVHRSVSG